MVVPTDYEKEGVVVRIEAVAGKHFVFQSPVLDDSQYGHTLPPTHNPRPTAHMRHNPQYRPPSGPRARPGYAAVARV